MLIEFCWWAAIICIAVFLSGQRESEEEGGRANRLVMENGKVENGKIENGVCYEQSANGGEDVWSCENGATSPSSVDHLVVMVNGILGSANDWKFGAEQFVQVLPDKVFVHCSRRNFAKFTLDGVDVMGDRLAEEVLEVIKEKPNLHKISFVAHSVGGLVARYAIARLYQSPKSSNASDISRSSSDETQRGTIGGLEAINFITVATPHLGSRGNKQVPFLFGLTAMEKFAAVIIHLIFRRTGKHLFLTDDERGKPPLLLRMVEDDGELHFMSALQAFRRRVAYSNVGYDHIVGWRTSSIRRISELPKWEESVDEKYPHVVYDEYRRPYDHDNAQDNSTGDCSSDKVEEELVTALSRLAWEKVDVSFHSSRLRYAAHSLIQVLLFSSIGFEYLCAGTQNLVVRVFSHSRLRVSGFYSSMIGSLLRWLPLV